MELLRTSPQRHWLRRLVGDYRIIWGQEGSKKTVASCPTSPSRVSLGSPTSEESTVGAWQQDSVISKAGRLTRRHTIHHASLPLVLMLRKVSGLLQSALVDLGSPVHGEQPDCSVCKGPLLAAGSRFCPSTIPILLVRLCQGSVSSPITWIWTAQVGGVRGQGGGPGCGPV